VPENAQETSDWSAVERPDGVRQWAYRGKPLYRYVKDTFPGARLGEEVGRIWHIMFEPTDVPAGMTIESTLLGRVLADYRGRTLYAVPSDAAANSEAQGSWAAFTAPWLAKGHGDWSIQANPDGTRQWAYKGQPLFTYEKDTDPQDIRGHGLAGRSAVILEPAPGMPSWVTVQQVDLGQVYADERGMTVYAPSDFEQIKAAQTCPEDCMQEYWRPMLAADNETSIGDWVILDNDAGQRQWSFKGRLLFTHTRDKKPGEMTGNGHAVGYRIGGGFRVILVDPRLRARG
jgi:predicted lipoprotein with Yx(FWY)xxD motif